MTENVNADPAELAKFSELAHKWWDMEGEFRPLHEINPLRLEWIEGIAPISQRRVVDIGCGGGILSDSMARKGADVLGADLAGKALKVAQLHALEAGTRGVKYREVSAEALAAETRAAVNAVPVSPDAVRTQADIEAFAQSLRDKAKAPPPLDRRPAR